MRRIPTDLEILKTIHKLYYDEYVNFDKDSSSRNFKLFVPIDIERIAKKLRTESDIVFARLYYNMEHKYGYDRSARLGADRVHFFMNKIPQVGSQKFEYHCINYPYMVAVLAELAEQYRSSRWNLFFAALSALCAFLSFCFAFS